MATKQRDTDARRIAASEALSRWSTKNIDNHGLNQTDVCAALLAELARRIASIPSAQARNLIINSLGIEIRCGVAAILVEMHRGE